MLSNLGLAGGLLLLILLTVRGVNILIAAPVSALLVALTSGLALLPPLAVDGGADFATAYMTGFTGFLATWFFMFLAGAIFGEVMATSGAADSVARFIVERLGLRYAALAVVAACAVLTYGGVSVFIVAFSVYPMALSLFRRADLPRRFIPAALAFGSVTFTMTSAGSPEIQNIIPMEYLGTTSFAGWQASLVVAILMAGLGYVWLMRMMARATAKGEAFDARAGDPSERDYADLPHPALAVAPLAAVLGVFYWLQGPLEKWALVAALAAGAGVGVLIGLKFLKQMPAAFSTGATGAVVAITNTCAVVGFGSVAKTTPAFERALDLVANVPGDPLIGAAIAVTVIAGLTGSASGGQTIALPLIAPVFLAQGVAPGELHRVVAISSGALDSLPHNGYVVTTIRAICGETHKDAYGPLGALTVLVPLLGLVVAIVLFILF